MELNYLLITEKGMYDLVVADRKNVIVPSNASNGGRGNGKMLNYGNWIDIDERMHDSSFVIVLNLLNTCVGKEVLLAEFDGFSININENY